MAADNISRDIASGGEWTVTVATLAELMSVPAVEGGLLRLLQANFENIYTSASVESLT